MTFGKGQQRQPNRKRAASKAPFRAAGTKTSRKRGKQACNQVQQEVEAVDAISEKVSNVDVEDEYLERAEPRDNAREESDEDTEDEEDDQDDEDDEDDEDDDDFIMGGKRRLTMEERKSLGMNIVTYEERRVSVKVAYVWEFDSPPENDWGPLVTLLKARVGLSRETIKKVFKGCLDGVANPEKKQKVCGRKHKLAEDNEGLIAGAAALNGCISPKMATEICNAVNETTYPDKDLKICRNTLLNTIKAYTDLESVAILRRKTGSKDPESAWAVSRVEFVTQLDDQMKLGKQIDDNVTSLRQVFEDVEKNNTPQPVWSDGILYTDENHCQASIGGAGHEGSFSKRQYRIAVDPKTGKLLRLANGGVVPKRKFRVVPKYTTEARGCYGVCSPIIDGKEQGQFIETFDYTGTKLLSIKAYKKLMEAEMTYRRGMKTRGWKDYNGKNPYLERYGEAEWEAQLKKSPSMRKFK